MSTQGQAIALYTKPEYFDHICNINIVGDIRTNTQCTIFRTSDSFWIDAIRIQNEHNINKNNKFNKKLVCSGSPLSF